jgi:hypothetical protein
MIFCPGEANLISAKLRGLERKSHFSESEQSILGKRRLYTYCTEHVMQRSVRHRIVARSKRLLDLAGSIGLDARDNDETALRKRVAVLLFSRPLIDQNFGLVTSCQSLLHSLTHRLALARHRAAFGFNSETWATTDVVQPPKVTSFPRNQLRD